MISLIQLILLISKSNINTPGPTPKLPNAEYLDVDITPTLSVTQVYYKNFLHTENLTAGLTSILLVVTKTGSNPL